MSECGFNNAQSKPSHSSWGPPERGPTCLIFPEATGNLWNGGGWADRSFGLFCVLLVAVSAGTLLGTYPGLGLVYGYWVRCGGARLGSHGMDTHSTRLQDNGYNRGRTFGCSLQQHQHLRAQSCLVGVTSRYLGLSPRNHQQPSCNGAVLHEPYCLSSTYLPLGQQSFAAGE